MESLTCLSWDGGHIIHLKGRPDHSQAVRSDVYGVKQTIQINCSVKLLQKTISLSTSQSFHIQILVQWVLHWHNVILQPDLMRLCLNIDMFVVNVWIYTETRTYAQDLKWKYVYISTAFHFWSCWKCNSQPINSLFNKH